MNSLRIIEDVISYAQLADKMGFKRFWLAEHHISDSLAAWYDPMPVITLLAGMTSKIITGIAGSQLNIHSPYHLALGYKLLANLFPERIDLGLASGKPGPNILELVGQQELSFIDKKRLLVKLLREEESLANEKEVIIPPYKGAIPNLWLLGTNYNRLGEAIEHQLNFSRSLFHGSDLSYRKDDLTDFKRLFFEKHKRVPELTLAFSGCCHLTDLKAKKVSESANYKGILNINIVGCIERFKDTILMYQDKYGYDEFTFLNIARSPKDRRIAIDLIQKAFSLNIE